MTRNFESSSPAGGDQSAPRRPPPATVAEFFGKPAAAETSGVGSASSTRRNDELLANRAPHAHRRDGRPSLSLRNSSPSVRPSARRIASHRILWPHYSRDSTRRVIARTANGHSVNGRCGGGRI